MNVGVQCDESESCRFKNRNRNFEFATELFTPVVVANVEIKALEIISHGRI